jgi:Protein of unknown function (DUF3999)
MKSVLGLLVLLLFAGPSVSFFKYERIIPATSSAGQHYIVMDETIWQHARPDLGDLRLYAADREVGYAVDIERGGAEIEQKEIRVLQPAAIAGKTQFLLDMSGVAEYDRVALRLGTKNFVAHARVSGQDDPHGSHWALLGTTTIYDLSAEKLGRNSTLQVPPATYKFLQVVIDNSVKPAEVLGGTAGITRSEKAVWRGVGSSPTVEQKDKGTVLTFTVPQNAPVERIVFDIDPSQPNFRRDLEIEGANRNLLGSGEITRVHMQRGGQKIDVEQMSADIAGRGQGTLKVVVHNGDDPPLKITGARLEQYERRIYFDAASGNAVTLYYGDTQLSAPVYDYAKLFQKDANASAIDLGAETGNGGYTGRPDGRPWSERHPAVLWGAIIGAVLVLGALALNSLKSSTAQ